MDRMDNTMVIRVLPSEIEAASYDRAGLSCSEDIAGSAFIYNSLNWKGFRYIFLMMVEKKNCLIACVLQQRWRFSFLGRG